MCTNLKIIVNPHNHSLYEVDCRKCLECLYNKSQRYMSILMANKSKEFNQIFVTLTYSNGYCPYLKRSELFNMLDHGTVPSVYRDYDIYHFVSHGVDKYRYYYNVSNVFKYAYKLTYDKIISLPNLVKFHPVGSLPTFYNDRIGVLDYCDIQKFFKCLRHHFNFKYYVIGEYGSKAELFRPHWHVLFYLPLSLNIDFFKELVTRYWFRSAKNQIKFLPAYHIEQYVSLYSTKVSVYPEGLFALQNRFVRYSRSVGCQSNVTLNMLSFDLHYYKRTKFGNVLKLLPNQREANLLYPIKKIPYIPLTWESQLSTLIPLDSRFSNPVRKGKNLSQLIDFAFDSVRFHNRLASQRLRDYLEEFPTIYTEHKEISLRNFHFKRLYGFKPSKQVRHFLLNYKSDYRKNLHSVDNFFIKSNLNLHYYEHFQTP